MLDVTFRLLNPETDSSQKVYLVGNFNGWQLPTDPMQYNPNTGFWEQTIRVPEGVYQYQYMRRVNGELEPIVGAYSYADIPTSFSTQIYYKDPELYLYRLLQVGLITSN
jgi:1,4-alpha-glucan branching enzyme